MSKKNWSNKAQLSAGDISTALEAFNKLPEVLEPMARTTVSADNVKHLFDKDKNFKDKLSKFKFIKMVKAGQVKGVTPSMVDDIT